MLSVQLLQSLINLQITAYCYTVSWSLVYRLCWTQLTGSSNESKSPSSLLSALTRNKVLAPNLSDGENIPTWLANKLFTLRLSHHKVRLS